MSFLKSFHENLVNVTRKQACRAPPMIRKRFDREIERILDYKTEGQSKKNRRTHYLVKWNGLLELEASWEN